MSIQVKSEAEFRKWRKRARELRARIEDPENAPVVVELMNELEKLQQKVKKMDKRVRTLESQVQKAYASYITGIENVG